MVLPYLKGLVIIKCGFFYLALWIYCVFSICGDYICRSIPILDLNEPVAIMEDMDQPGQAHDNQGNGNEMDQYSNS
jgi:hypothetical protein